MGRKTIDRIEQGVKKMINKKRFKCRPWPVNIQVNLFSYIFRILFQDCQWKIYFKSILGTH